MSALWAFLAAPAAAGIGLASGRLIWAWRFWRFRRRTIAANRRRDLRLRELEALERRLDQRE